MDLLILFYLGSLLTIIKGVADKNWYEIIGAGIIFFTINIGYSIESSEKQ